MLNQVTIVGRIIKIEEIEETEGKKTLILTLAIPRSYKNINGEYETDFVECIIYNGIASNVNEYCRKSDIVGIRGRLQNTDKKLEVIAERVTFLASKKENENDEHNIEFCKGEQ